VAAVVSVVAVAEEAATLLRLYRLRDGRTAGSC